MASSRLLRHSGNGRRPLGVIPPTTTTEAQEPIYAPRVPNSLRPAAFTRAGSRER